MFYGDICDNLVLLELNTPTDGRFHHVGVVFLDTFYIHFGP